MSDSIKKLDYVIESIVTEGLLKSTADFASKMWGDLKRVPSKYKTELKTSPFGEQRGGQYFSKSKLTGTPAEALASHLSNLEYEGRTGKAVQDYRKNLDVPTLTRNQAGVLLRKGVIGNEKAKRFRDFSKAAEEKEARTIATRTARKTLGGKGSAEAVLNLTNDLLKKKY